MSPGNTPLTGCTCGADTVPGKADREAHSDKCAKYRHSGLVIDPKLLNAPLNFPPVDFVGAGMKRVSDITIEGHFIERPADTEAGVLDVFDTAKIGQVLNIVTGTRTLKFVLVQIT